MVFRKYFNLPLALLTSSFKAALADAAPLDLQVLTPDTFKSSVASGIWLVEHFSPYCHHCQEFASTWEKLVSQQLASNSVAHLAQVNCAVNGDLCNANKVNGYPQLNLYKDGEFIERYKGARELDSLIEYLVKFTESASPAADPTTTPISSPSSQPMPSPPKKIEIYDPDLNPLGSVLALDGTSFQSTLSLGPIFVKYFAPWCGHCKKLAPTWTQLAKHMQKKVNIAEVNCEDHASLCKQQDIQGYPMLFFYNNGIKAEYTGGRKLDQLRSFAEKASAPPVQELVVDELQRHIDEEEVLYLLLYSEVKGGLEEVKREAHELLGSPRIYTSSSQELFGRFKVPIGTSWALLALKDHDGTTPASIYYPPTVGESKLKQWLLANRLPTSIELTQETFQSVMNAAHKPLVVIAAVTADNKARVKERFQEVAARWRVRTAASGGSGVVFSWMDAERWSSWMKSMYGIKVSEGDEPKVIIADHSRLVYYDKDKQGRPFSLTSASLFPALEGIPNGELKKLHSENAVERMARFLNTKLTSIEYYFAHYPMQAVGFVVLIFVAVFYIVRRAAQPEMEDLKTHKNGRLD